LLEHLQRDSASTSIMEALIGGLEDIPRSIKISERQHHSLWKKLSHRMDRWYIYLLYTTHRLDLGIDTGGWSSSSMSARGFSGGLCGTE